MLVPLVLPFQISIVVLGALTLAAIAMSPLIGVKRIGAALFFPIVAAFAFPFVFSYAMYVVDSYRYGTFEFQSVSEIKDPRVDFCLPPTATKLTINKQGSGFRARYHIAKSDLDRFLDDEWRHYGATSSTERGELSTYSPIPREAHEIRYGDLRWPHLKDAVEYHGPTASDGGGFTIWYSEQHEIAYQFVGYF